MKRKKRRLILVVLILITAGLSYYFVEYSYKKELEKLQREQIDDKEKLFEDKTPAEVISLIQTKIDSLESRIQLQDKIIPYYSSPIKVYEKIIQTINLLDQKTEVNLDKLASEDLGGFKVEKFQIKGEGKFTDLFSLINLFETSSELYKIHLKDIKQIFTPDDNGKMVEKVLFNLNLDAFYTLNPDFNFDSLFSKKDLRTVVYISDFFESLIKLEIPTNDEGLLEVEGSKLLAIMPDGVYLLDKKGNSYTLAEGDEVYLGYLTKIDYQNHSCEFLLNKGGILERVTLQLDDKEKQR